MARSNAERQAAYRDRMRESGFTQTTIWVRADPVGQLRRLHDELVNRDPTLSAEAALDIVKARLGGALEDIIGYEP